MITENLIIINQTLGADDSYRRANAHAYSLHWFTYKLKGVETYVDTGNV